MRAGVRALRGAQRPPERAPARRAHREVATREAAAKAKELDALGKALERDRRAVDDEVARRLRARAGETRRAAEEKVREEIGAEMESLRETLDEQRKAPAGFREQEVALRREKARLEGSREE